MPVVLSATAVLALAGCEPPTYAFRPVDHPAGLNNDGTLEQAKYTVLAYEGDAATVRITAEGSHIGEPADRQGPPPTEILLIDFEFNNQTDRTIRLPARAVTLADDEGKVLKPARVYADESQAESIKIGPGTEKTVRLMFELGEGQSLDRLGSIRLGWQVRVGEEEESFITKFVKSQRPRTYYRDRYIYPPPYYHYYPWYYDRFYGHPGYYYW
jgi:hypothetical protein